MEQEHRKSNAGSWIFVISILMVAAANGAIGPAAEEFMDEFFSDVGVLLQNMGNDPPDSGNV